jgi:hypothetical protein
MKRGHELETMERGPGKYEGEVLATRIVHEEMMNGADEEFGDVQDVGWHGLATSVRLPSGAITHAIIIEDSVGFVSGKFYATAARAKAAFNKMRDELEPDSGDDDEEEDEEDDDDGLPEEYDDEEDEA